MNAEDAALGRVGETIAEKYRVLRLLGAGGMGAVYEAEHVFTRRHVALKCMHARIAKSRIAAERFVRESQAPSSIGHPGIVQVLDGGFAEDGSLYLVLELLEGMSMADALEEDALEPTSIVQIGIELLEALAAAHAKGFIHRDIKPDNVFLTHDGRGGVAVKLLDFGIASVQTNDGDVKLTQTGAVLGTPLYMSPEQAKGKRIDARSDLWSVGAMLYRALAGESPYQGESYNALIVSIVTQEHVPLGAKRSGLPHALLDVVERALQKNVDQRYQTASEMVEALRQVRFDWNADSGEPAKLPSLPPYDSLEPAARNTPNTPNSDRKREREIDCAREPHDATRAVPPTLMKEIAAAQQAAARPITRPVFTVPDAPPESALLTRLALLGAVAGVLALTWSLGLRPRHPQLPPSPSVSSVNSDPIRIEGQPEPARAVEPAVEPAQPRPTEASARPTDSAKPPLAAAANDDSNTARAADPQPVPQPLPPEMLTRTLSEHQAEMQHCLEEAVVAQMLAGSTQTEALVLNIGLEIAATGRVDSVEVQGKAPPELIRCVRERLEAATFPEAGAPTEFHYPLLFQPTIVGK